MSSLINNFTDIKRVYYKKATNQTTYEIRSIYEKDSLNGTMKMLWHRPGKSASFSFTLSEETEISFYYTQSAPHAVHIFQNATDFNQRITSDNYISAAELNAVTTLTLPSGDNTIYFTLEKGTSWSPGGTKDGSPCGFFGITKSESEEEETNNFNLSNGQFYANKTITNLRDYAFCGCIGLYRFNSTTNIPVDIGDYAFYHCDSFSKWSIASLQRIGNYAFNKTNMSAININGNITFANDCFVNENFPQNNIILNLQGSSSLNSGLLQNNSSLKKVVLNGSYSSIPSNCFKGCSALKEVEITSSYVSSIGANAFQNCSSLENISFPSNLSSIGSYAFQYCTSLGQTVFPSKLSSIGSYAFDHCSSLNFNTLPSNLTVIQDRAFSYCPALTLRNVIPKTYTTLGNSIYNHCTGLTNIVINGNITGTSLFAYCTGIKTIWITQNCQEITPAITSVTNAPFYHCNSTDGKIYAVVTKSNKPSTWSDYFKFTGEDEAFIVEWGYNNDPIAEI